jgi:hypothetical protein
MSSSLSCPVPKEQQPINEYQELQASWFFKWGKLTLAAYSYKLFRIWLWGSIVTGPIAADSFPIHQEPLHFALAGMGGSLLFVALAAAYLYAGWAHVDRRLQATAVVYEESGWYDGQTWTKTAEVLTRDRLLASHEVRPVIRRLQLTFLSMLSVIGAGSLVWYLSLIV